MRAAPCDQFSRTKQLLPVIFHRRTPPDSKRFPKMPLSQKSDLKSWKYRIIGILRASKLQLIFGVRARDQFSRAERELNVRIACLNSIKLPLGVVLACLQNTVIMVIFELKNKVCLLSRANMGNACPITSFFLETLRHFRRGKIGRAPPDSNKK